MGQLRGRLGCLEILKNGNLFGNDDFPGAALSSLLSLRRFLRGDYFCYRKRQRRRLEVYRFSRFPTKSNRSRRREGVALVDTTPVFVENRWYIFTTTIEPFMETVLFSAARIEGPWTLHPSVPLPRPSRAAAPRANWFGETEGCIVPRKIARYGYAHHGRNEVTKLTEIN